MNINNYGSDDIDRDDDEMSATVSTTMGSELHHHQSVTNRSYSSNNTASRRGSSSSSPFTAGGTSRSLTVTKNVNNSSAVPEDLRVQASEYLASYIKVRSFSYTCIL